MKAKKHIHLIPDELTFSEKINFAKVLKYYSNHISHKINFNLSFDINNLRKINNLRNQIVHHDFILLNQTNLMNVLNLLKKYITLDYSERYDFFVKETKTFLNDIYGNTI